MNIGEREELQPEHINEIDDIFLHNNISYSSDWNVRLHFVVFILNTVFISNIENNISYLWNKWIIGHYANREIRKESRQVFGIDKVDALDFICDRYNYTAELLVWISVRKFFAFDINQRNQFSTLIERRKFILFDKYLNVFNNKSKNIWNNSYL